MAHTEKSWRAHPHCNPLHRFGQPRTRTEVEIFPGRTITRLGPKNPNRWLPHQGAREIARRQRQAAKKPTV